MDDSFKRILSGVEKPGRYAGNEINVCKKNNFKIRFGLVFPDAYEVGMSNLGIKILYHILNSDERIFAERVFSPWVDMEKELRNNNYPLVSLESKTPVREFDALGFSMHYELCYTNALNVLSLAGIPFKSKERDGSFPLIIAGGPSLANPEPVAEFFDAIFIGEAEESIISICEEIIGWKESGRKDKDALLRRLAGIEGIYAPSLYAEKKTGRFVTVEKKYGSAPDKVKRKTVKNLDTAEFPVNQIVPYLPVIHDRAMLELFRGCTRGCRFCQAGVIYRPARMRKIETLLNQADELIRNTGYEEIALTSLSSTDYPGINCLVGNLSEMLKDRRVSISLPSLRSEVFSKHIAETLIGTGKTGLTFAPEAGTQRLRSVINKSGQFDDIERTVETAVSAGWNKVKLYFLIGLPTETDEDLRGIADVCRNIIKIGEKHRRRLDINVSISGFIPKPHTPFQWEPFCGIDALNEKIKFLRSAVRERRVNLKFGNPEISAVECMFSRGDRRLNNLLIQAHSDGCRFDGWKDFFKYQTWMTAADKCGINISDFTGGIELREDLPWDFIDIGVKKEFLIKESENARSAVSLDDCRFTDCKQCGACDDGRPDACVVWQGASKDAKKDGSVRTSAKRNLQESIRYKIRARYAKKGDLRYTSHLDVIRYFSRIIRRTDLPVAYSRGFSPRPLISFGHALSLGFESEAEYVDFEFSAGVSARGFVDEMNKFLREGIVIKEAKLIPAVSRSLSETVNLIRYNIKNAEINDEGIEKKEKIKYINRISDMEYDVMLYVGSKGCVNPKDLIKDGEKLKTAEITRTGQYEEFRAELKTPFEVV